MSSTNNPLESSINPLYSLLNISPRKSVTKEKKIPKNIGPYELKEKIIDGCYCKIYLGKSKYTGDKVAIKVIEKIFFLENMEDLLLIKRQIEILKIIKHRNILTLYEIYESRDFIFLIMEYIPGKNLCEMIVTKRRFSEEEAKKIFVQIVDALDYLHRMNICHRNITSNHILFDINNIPKLISFSYSTFYDKNQELKDSFGSLCHSCPEIISESPYKPELSDTWSLGTVLYTMVAGYLPFSEENDEKNKELIVCGKVEYPNEMSNKLKDLLRHMMEPNPNKRYDLNKIMKHPWFKPYNEKLIGGCNFLKMIVPVDKKIMNIIKKLGFDKEKIKKDLIKNKYNQGTGLYKLLVKRANILGFHSVSDLGSKEYFTYKDNRNNYIIDGDIKYEKYLQEVKKRMELVEKSIFQFQEKEENIIKELDKLEESIKNNNNNNIGSIIDKDRESSIKNVNRKSTKRQSPEQKSNIIDDNNINKKLKKIKSCSNFPKILNLLASINQSINKKKNNIKNKPRLTHFSNNNESWQDTSIFIKKRKSYLNNSTFFESLLKKNHPENLRKSEARKNIISDINQVIIEEKEKENNNKEKKRSLRFSISFTDNDDDNDNYSEGSDDNISKVDSRQLSMFDEDGIKFLKELKMIGSNYAYKGKKKSEIIMNNGEKKINKEDKNPIVSKFVNFDEDIDNDKKGKDNIKKKETNEIENIYSTIKSENIEIKKEIINHQMKEIKEINEIIISSKPEEKKIPVEKISFYNDKRKLSKLIINNFLTEDFCSIEFIQNKYREKYELTFYKDTKKANKINIIDCHTSYPINNINYKKEELNTSQINKEENIININSSCNSNEEIIIVKNDIKKNPLQKNNNEEEDNLVNKIYSTSSALALKNMNKYAKSMNTQKNRVKDKIKLVKKPIIKCKKYKSDVCHSKYCEDLSFINISEISEIKPSSIMSPSYLNTNMENKENILLNNNYIDNKSFQSKSQISNLSMTHENNIFLGNANTIYTFHLNNYYDNDLNNFYMVHLDNYNKNTYSQNHLLNIKKRNLAQRLKEEIQKSIDKKQIKSSLLMTSSLNGMNNKKTSNKKIGSIKKRINNNNKYSKNTNTIHVNSSKLNGNSIKSDKNTIRKIKNNMPEYVNFIKIRQEQIINSMSHENKIKSNGKSVEIAKNENRDVKMNKSKKKKIEDRFPEKFIFCSSVRNFNNYCCFNMKHRRDYDKCSIKKKQNKSVSKRNCDCDKNKNNKEANYIKSNGKKIEISKEELQNGQNNGTYRSYLNIYEKDKKLKLNKEKMKNGKNEKDNKITYIYKNDMKKCEYTYRRVLFKMNP